MIPTAVLRHRVDIEPSAGPTGKGVPTYGPKRRRVPAWVQAGTRTIRTTDGNDVVASATCLLGPSTRPSTPTVNDGARITHGTKAYTVLGVQVVNDGAGEHSQLLALEGPR